MSEMVERVAQAIMRVEWDDKISDYYKFARAAIEAMREPTVEMCRDAAWDDYGPDECRTCWRAMIDAALAPPRSP